MDALSFMERGGGVPSAAALHKNPILIAAVNDIKGAGAVAMKGRGQAPRLPIQIVVALERLVMLTGAARYVRMYAWFRLVKVWGTLRFDDHRGLVPSTMSMRSDGMHGTLERTKTSGLGKARQHLPLFVAKGAALSDPDWLAVGWALWESASPGRDYFVGLPSEDLQRMRDVEAKYPDGLAMGRALLREVRSGDGEVLLTPGVEQFWSEHSERATLPSWVGCVESFPADWIDSLGRWSGGCSEGYVRTAKLRVRKMQHAVVERYRSSAEPGVDFGEDDIFVQLKAWMLSKGFSETVASDQVDRLLTTPFSDRPPLPTEVAEESDAEELEEGAETPVPLPLASSRLVIRDPEEQELELGSFLVSVQTKTRFRRLHKLGECWRKPGVDYLEYEVLGLELPPAASYNAVCHQCFKKGEVNEAVTSSGSSSSEDSAGS